MNPLRTHSWVVALLLAVLAGPAFGDDTVKLEYKLNKGDQLIYNTRSEIKQVQTVGGTDVANEMKVGSWVVRTVDQVDDQGDIHLTSETKRLKIDAVFGPLGKYSFDSESEDRDTASVIGAAATPVFERLAGATLQAVLSPRGKVKKVEGYKELLADVLENNPLAGQFAGGGSDEAAVLETQQQFLELPDKPVAPGDTWEAAYEIKLPSIGTFRAKTKYRYVGPDKVGDQTTAKVQATSDLTLDIDLKTDMAEATGKLSTTMSSATIQFDVERGRVLSIDDNFGLEGDMTVTAGGNVITIHQKQTQKILVHLHDNLPE